MKRPFLVAAIGAMSVAPSGSALSQDTFVRTTAFQGIAWPADTTQPPGVQLGQRWFRLIAVDSVPVSRLFESARALYAARWKSEFDEHLHEILISAGRPARLRVVLSVRDSATNELLQRSVTLGIALGGVQPPATLSALDISGDLDALQEVLETQWAYLKTNGVDHRAAFASLRSAAAGGMMRDAYGLEVLKLISLFIDGHASVGGFAYPASASLPFVVESAGDRFVAVAAGRTRLVDSLHPFVTSLDGRPVSAWLQAASAYVSKASPQWTENRALRLLPRINFIRGLMGLPARDSIVVELTSQDGRSSRRAVMAVGRPASNPALPARLSQVLDGNIGYLRLASMDDAAVQEVARWMPQFRDTRGLIIDVRGNSGGSRDALRALFPYLMSPTDAPRVINAAKYRLAPSFTEDHLGGSRYMYRESWSGWTAEERAAIARFKTTFTPEWEPPPAEFSDWHYIVMSRRSNPEAYFYARPVIVLHDAGSFSATDIFVAAFKGWRNVTLAGMPTGGGSARQVPVSLPVSRLSLSLASMASFRWDGKLFDGNGTAPDVIVRPDPESFLINGRDNVLERAISMLVSRTP